MVTGSKYPISVYEQDLQQGTQHTSLRNTRKDKVTAIGEVQGAEGFPELNFIILW